MATATATPPPVDAAAGAAQLTPLSDLVDPLALLPELVAPPVAATPAQPPPLQAPTIAVAVDALMPLPELVTVAPLRSPHRFAAAVAAPLPAVPLPPLR